MTKRIEFKPSVAWQAEIVPLAIGLASNPAARPAAVLIVGDGLILGAEILERPPADPKGVAGEIAKAVRRAAETADRLPHVIAVRHPDVADELQPLLAPDHVSPYWADELDDLDEAAASLSRHMTRGGPTGWSSPETWAGWGLPTETVAAIFRAAAGYWRAAPWRLLDNLQILHATTPGVRTWVAGLLGNGGQQFGLVLYSSAEDFGRYADAADEVTRDRIEEIRRPVLSISYDRRDDLPAPMRREVKRAGWEVAGRPQAFPILMAMNTLGGGITAADAADLIALLEAIPRFVEAHRAAFETEDPPPIDWRDPATGSALSYRGRFGEESDAERRRH